MSVNWNFFKNISKKTKDLSGTEVYFPKNKAGS